MAFGCRRETYIRTAGLKMVDVHSNRRQTKWSAKEKLGRVAWGLTYPMFRFSPRIFWGWRRFILRLFGAQIGSSAHIYPTVRIAIPWNLDLGAFTAVGDRVTLYSLGLITLGRNSTISQNSHICAGTHDLRDPTRPLLKTPIKIGSNVWICADAFVGPGVRIGDGAVVGARAVVMKDVGGHLIVAGNPSSVIGSLSADKDAQRKNPSLQL